MEIAKAMNNKLLIKKRGNQMRRKVVAGNWKMNMLPNEAMSFIRQIESEVNNSKAGEVVLNKFIEKLEDIATVEKAPKLEGRNMFTILAKKAEK